MPIIYDVKIEPSEIDNQFRVTWQKNGTIEQETFTCNLPDIDEKKFLEWEKRSNQFEIGRALFYFLDGCKKTNGYFTSVLDPALKEGKKIQINLRTCKQTADWPFELIARGDEFLLLRHVHLVRRISDRGIESASPPLNDWLRLLFMASDPIHKESLLHYEQEEEAILNITQYLPIEIEVEDSGSLKGLKRRLVPKQYDIIHLSAHALIENYKPYFKMEDDTGRLARVFPEQLWDEALIENPPRLLFLSGCRTGQMSKIKESGYVVSFAREMVERFKIPAVLGWGHSVSDELSIHGEEVLYYELSSGHSILAAVHRARFEMQKKYPGDDEPAWPQLRLFSNGTPLGAIVTGKQEPKPKPRQIAHTYLANSKIKVLPEGFIGRRRQIQHSMEALDDNNFDRVGVLLLGTGGLGKSCLAGKICERFPLHTVIPHQGKLNKNSIVAALKKTFDTTDDDKGLEILSAQKTPMTDKLADLCATSFKNSHYILLLDGFEQNLKKTGNGGIGELNKAAAELLHSLLYYLPFCGKMTILAITSRFPFVLLNRGRDMVEERMKKVWLTSFRDSEILRKVRELIHLSSLDKSLKELLKNAGYGNPLLLEQIDQIAGKMQTGDGGGLQDAVKTAVDNFLNQTRLYELYRQCGKSLKRIIERLRVYPNPISEDHIRQYEPEITACSNWKELLREGMNLGIVEHDQAKRTYGLNPMFKEKVKF